MKACLQRAVFERFEMAKGQAYIASLGLYYYKARFYAPSLGKFLQPDPIGYAGGMNLYAYVGGDPVNHRDPSGLFTCERTYTYHGYTDGEGDYVSVAKFDGWSCHGDPWDYGPIGPIGELVSGGGDSGGGDSGEAPQKAQPTKPAYCSSLGYLVGDFIDSK